VGFDFCLQLGFYFKLESFDLFFLKLFGFVEVARKGIGTRAAGELGVECVTLRNKLNNFFCVANQDWLIYVLAVSVDVLVTFHSLFNSSIKLGLIKLAGLLYMLLSHILFLFYLWFI